jgi:protein SCO1/2
MFVRLFSILFFLSLFIRPASAHLPGGPKKGESARKTVSVPVQDFTLTDQDGKEFRFQSLRGKVVLITFIFTTCPDFCPLLTAKLSHIQRKLQAERKDGYFLLTITTDPEIDKPSVLKSYGERYRVDLRSWAFLTGDEKDLSKVWDTFGVKVKKLSNGQVHHTGLTVLVDREGIQRVNYFGDRWQEKEILKDLETLAAGG